MLHVGKDNPTGLAHVKEVWKKPRAIPKTHLPVSWILPPAREEEILRAVNKGRFMVKEMIGVNQVKEYRVMKAPYDGKDGPDVVAQRATEHLEKGCGRD